MEQLNIIDNKVKNIMSKIGIWSIGIPIISIIFLPLLIVVICFFAFFYYDVFEIPYKKQIPVVQQYKLKSGDTIKNFLEKKFGKKPSLKISDWGYGEFSIAYAIQRSEKDSILVFRWTVEDKKVLAATNRTKDLMPELGSPCDTSDIEYDQLYNPFVICTGLGNL